MGLIYTVRKDGAFFVTDNLWRWALLTVALLKYFSGFSTSPDDHGK
jgi:hypothetical protein